MQAAIQVPWMTEQPTRAAGAPRPREKVPARVSHFTYPVTHTVRCTGCGGIIALTSDGASRSATDDVACVAGSLATSPSERPGSDESDEASGRGEDDEVVELHVGFSATERVSMV